MIKLILGLGNPGNVYVKTYHNVGFLFVDKMAEGEASWQKPKSKKFEFFKTEKYILAKTLTYMNESGIAAGEVLKFFDLKPQEMLIAHDDSDIFLGEYKFSFESGSAGHKGVQSVMNTIKSSNFWRLRIGIRPKENIGAGKKRAKAETFVLKNIKKSDSDLLNFAFISAEKELGDL